MIAYQLRKSLIAVLCICILHTHLSAQEKSTSLQDALKKVTKTFGIQFVYDPELLAGKTTSYDLDNISKKTAEEVLKAVLYPHNIVFLYVKPKYYTIVSKDKIDGNTKQPVHNSTSQVQEDNNATVNNSAKHNVSGVVTDSAGNAIPQVSIIEKGTKNSTLTNPGGTFQLNVSSGKAKLVISFVGLEEVEVAVNNQKELSVTLKTANLNLSDVVVIGYATVKKKDVTGAVASIGEKDIKSRPVDNALEAMQGKVAGVDIGSNERPGTVPSINIRGVRSLTASNSPLFVVDGIPLSTGGIENINPGDIESIDVLKDASATAIYGSRGANGVVIVTTKQGKAGKVTLSFNSSVTIDELVDNQEMFNASDYITFRRWAYYYAGLNPATGVSTYPRGDQPDISRDRTYFNATGDPSAWANIAKG